MGRPLEIFMPCSVTKGEMEYYEKEANLKKYGVAELSGRVAESVACELSKLLTADQLAELTPMAVKWIRLHAAKDAQRAGS